MFITTELMFKTLELKFVTIELKFRTFEHRFNLGETRLETAYLFFINRLLTTLISGVTALTPKRSFDSTLEEARVSF